MSSSQHTPTNFVYLLWRGGGGEERGRIYSYEFKKKKFRFEEVVCIMYALFKDRSSRMMPIRRQKHGSG